MARHKCAEQGSPGKGLLGSNKTSQGGVAMVKTVGNVVSCTTLVVLGWISFFSSLLVSANHPFLKVSLMAIARVLP